MMFHSEKSAVFSPIKRLLAVLLATALLSLVPAAKAEAKTFKNCTDLRQTYKNGVSLNRTALNKGTGPILSPTMNAAVFRLNKKLDTDRDNIACEVLRPRVTVTPIPAPIPTPTPTTTPSPTPSATPTPTASPAPTAPPAAATITSEEVAKNNSRESCWVIISGSVYNLTEWIRLHPGGAGNILNLCGRDGTSSFSGMHGGQAGPRSILQGYFLAELRR